MNLKQRAFNLRIANQKVLEKITNILTDTQLDELSQLNSIRGIMFTWAILLKETLLKNKNDSKA